MLKGVYRNRWELDLNSDDASWLWTSGAILFGFDRLLPKQAPECLEEH